MMKKSEPLPASEHFRTQLQRRYDRLWAGGIERIRKGTVERDSVLQRRQPDQRRGLTLIARPSAEIRQEIMGLLACLKRLEPDQHYYLPSELHLTVLSLFTATTEHARFFAQTEQYLAAVESALERRLAPIRIGFAGVTVSPGSVMIQGLFDTNALNALRAGLRQELRCRHLTEGLDRRYRLETAHMTVARFRAPLRDSGQFAEVLEAARNQWFGAMEITHVSLVQNDWYMTRSVVKTLNCYKLRCG